MTPQQQLKVFWTRAPSVRRNHSFFYYAVTTSGHRWIVRNGRRYNLQGEREFIYASRSSLAAIVRYATSQYTYIVPGYRLEEIDL